MNAGAAITYVRFVLLDINQDSGAKEGLFNTAYALRRVGELTMDQYEELDHLLRWFGENLEIPTRFNKSQSKGYSRRNTKGISWLKPTADLHIAKMRQVATILEQQGHMVTVIRTSKPGYVVHEDEHQLVAEPFSDLRG